MCIRDSHNTTAAALSTSFLLHHAPQQPRAGRIDYKIWGVIQQREYGSWVNKIEEIKQQLVEFRQRTNTVEWTIQFSCFPFCLVVQKHKLLHVVYNFIGNIYAKIYQNPFTYFKVIASQRWNVFETRCIYHFPLVICILYLAAHFPDVTTGLL